MEEAAARSGRLSWSKMKGVTSSINSSHRGGGHISSPDTAETGDDYDDIDGAAAAAADAAADNDDGLQV